MPGAARNVHALTQDVVRFPDSPINHPRDLAIL